MIRALVCVLLLGLSACIVVPVPIPVAAIAPAPNVMKGPTSVDSFGSALNAQRRAVGLNSLVRNPILEAAALAHAQDMGARNYFDHRDPNGRGPADRARARGYQYCRIAENIASGQETEAVVLQAWLNSPPHRRNMLTADYYEYGLARSKNVWVLMVGKRC